MTLHIIGYGYVGSSLGYVCKQNNVEFSITDIQDKLEDCAVYVFKEVQDTVRFAETTGDFNVYFVCVPTPSKPSGECCTDIVEDVVSKIYEFATKKSIICVKSTVQPGTCRKLLTKYGCAKSNIDIVFTSEFLTERRANLDMYEAKFALVGTHDGVEIPEIVQVFKSLYNHNYSLEVITRKLEVCELFKYTINMFLAVKVWFFNEIYEISDKLDFDYNELRDLLKLDSRIGESHIMVPGLDGKFGYGGACLKKEMLAGNHLQTQQEIPNNVIEQIISRNDQLRQKLVNK